MTKNALSLFSVDAVKKTISASKAALSRAKNPDSDEYAALNLLRADNPGFKIVEKKSNKTSYKELSFDFMRAYIRIQDDCDDLMEEFETLKLLNNDKYPIVKKWFLDTFKDDSGKFNMNKAKREIAQGKINAAKVMVKKVKKDISDNTLTHPKVA